MIECYGRYKNTHPDLISTLGVEHVSGFIKLSSWSFSDRLDIATGAFQLYSKHLKSHIEGTQHIYRNKKGRSTQEKGKFQDNLWFMKGGNLKIYKTPYTPGNKLTILLRKKERKRAEGGGIRIVVKA